MDTLQAIANGMANSNKPLMVFDWNKAARLINEHKPKEARAGLRGDWEWTGGTIFLDSKPIFDSYTYLSSTWATPELMIDEKVFDCYKMQRETNWGAHTKWPESALEIINTINQ